MNRKVPLAMVAGLTMVCLPRSVAAWGVPLPYEIFDGIQTINRWDRLPPIYGSINQTQQAPTNLLPVLTLPAPYRDPVQDPPADQSLKVAALTGKPDRLARPSPLARTRPSAKQPPFDRTMRGPTAALPQKIIPQHDLSG